MADAPLRENKTALVTGATGFVGSAVARKLLMRGDRVRVLARAGSDRSNLTGLDVTVIEGDLLKPETLTAAVEGCDQVYHVAADYRLWTRHPEELYQSNVDGSVELIRAAQAAGASRIVYCSSVAVLGINKDRTPSNEDTPVSETDMIGHYKRSKFLAEEAVRKLIVEEGAPVVIVNPSTPIGPRDIKPTPTGRMVLDAARGKMPAYVETGLNIVHVNDVAEGHLLAAEKGRVGERYILGGENLSLREILTEIAHMSGRKPPKICLPRGPLFPLAAIVEGWARLTGVEDPLLTIDGLKMAGKMMWFSSEKAVKELGFTPRPATEALRDAVRWFEAEGKMR